MRTLHALLALPLVALALACSSTEKAPEETALVESQLPEVRYYVIADT